MPRYRRGRDWEESADYDMGYDDGYDAAMRKGRTRRPTTRPARKRSPPKKARKLTAWNRYVKNKKNHIKMRDGKLNLKKMAVQFRKKRK
jgi:hypothetical protein